jgi:DNA-damage-inducible protein J
MPTSSTTMLHIRVDQNLKTRASETLDKMGLSLSDAVRLLLTRIVVEEALPFEVRVPNAGTRAAMEAGDRGELSKASRVAEMMTRLDTND